MDPTVVAGVLILLSVGLLVVGGYLYQMYRERKARW
jgi:hypothetical protein